MSEPEVALEGGNLTEVVRVGDTVRRKAGPWTPMVHDLLRHVRDRGFELAPEPLGLDEQGREVLRYLPGDTMTSHPWPRWVWGDVLLVEAARALATYHLAASDFRPAVVESRLGPTRLAEGEIVCHNDFAPYNSVFRAHHLSGIIDWDIVRAADPTWDLAFVAWHWVPLHAPSEGLEWRTPADCARRLRLLLDTYQPRDTVGFLDKIVGRIDASRTGILENARGGDPVFIRLEQEGHADTMSAAIEFIGSIESLLRRATDGS